MRMFALLHLLRRAPRAVGLSAAALLCSGPLASPLAAQTFDWVQPRTISYAHNPDMVRTAAAPLPEGGSWWVALENRLQFYSSEALGTLHLTRLRANGAVAFDRIIAGNASILQAQAAPGGGVVLLGEYLDSLVLAPQQRYLNPHPTTGLEYFLACLDSVGNVRWTRPLRSLNPPSAGFVQGANALTLDPRGGSVWAGYDTFGDSYATRFDLATGDSLSSIVQQRVARITSVTVAPDGTTYVAGSCADDGSRYNGTAVPLPSSLAPLAYNTYVACYSATGAYQWVQHVEDITCPATWVSTSDNGGVYFVGPLHGPWQFGPFQAGASSSIASPAYFITRLARQTGQFQWLQESPSTSFTGSTQPAFHQPLAADAAGNAWLLTNTTGTTRWPGFGAQTSPLGGAAALLAYSATGTLLTVELGMGRLSAAHTLALDAGSGRGVIAGVAHEGGLQLGTLPQLPLVGVNQIQLFTAGFRPTLVPLSTPAAASPAEAALYPNPVAAGSRLHLTAPARLTEALVSDALGRPVGRYALAHTSAEIPAPAVPGVYTLQVRDAAHHLTTRRLVVQ